MAVTSIICLRRSTKYGAYRASDFLYGIKHSNAAIFCNILTLDEQRGYSVHISIMARLCVWGSKAPLILCYNTLLTVWFIVIWFFLRLKYSIEIWPFCLGDFWLFSGQCSKCLLPFMTETKNWHCIPKQVLQMLLRKVIYWYIVLCSTSLKCRKT